MVKSEPKKKPQSGGFFQKFFRKPEKSQKEQRLTVQRSIPYLEMGRDGICRVEEHLYSKTVRFYDINYQLAQNEDKNTIFESWCDFLNYFDASIRFQLSFINHKSDMSEYNKVMDIEDLEKQAEAIRVEQIKLYESYADGVLLRDAYIEKKKALSEKLAALQDSIRTEKEEQECADELDEEIRALTKQASEKTYIGGLTKECVDAFVSMVYLYDDQTMKIEFNCEDVIRRALEKYGA